MAYAGKGLTMAEQTGRSFIKPEFYESEIRRARVLAAIDELIEADRRSQAEAQAATDQE